MFVYIAGPITPSNGFTSLQNMDVATAVYFDLMGRGINAFCPHLHSAFPAQANNIGYERWMSYGFALIDISAAVLMLPRWQESLGAWREHRYAQKSGKAIFYNTEDLLRNLPQ